MDRWAGAFLVVATVALECAFVSTALAALQNGADEVNWFIAVPVMLPVIMILFLYLAAFFHLLATRDFE
jgi:succinate dehydrogenase/fumarate reductase cytochrome b subunit